MHFQVILKHTATVFFVFLTLSSIPPKVGYTCIDKKGIKKTIVGYNEERREQAKLYIPINNHN